MVDSNYEKRLKNILKKKIVFKTITPLHIGSGEKYGSIDYVIYDGRFYRIDWDKFVNYIANLSKVEPNLGKVKLEELSKLLASRERISFEEILIGLNLKKEEVRNWSIYDFPFKGNRFNYEVEEFIKSSIEPYVPGSELKGSLRRALFLYFLNEDYGLFNAFKNKISWLNELDTSSDEFSRKKKEYYKRLDFLISELESQFFRLKSEDSYGDLLRFLLFADSNGIKISNVRIKGINIVYAKGGECGEVKVSRNNKPITIYSEVIEKGVSFEVEIFFDLEKFEAFKKYVARSKVQFMFDSFYKFLIENSDNILDRIVEIWVEGEKLSLKAEKKILSFLKASCLEELYSELDGSFIRIGKHEGYLFTTVAGILLLKGEEELFKKVFKIVGKKGNALPKTRKLIKEGSKFIPLGFCSIESIE
ncbi:type III-A CRISPR-associated RAMP protein Csm5 [Thermovibrio sp.]